MPVCECFEREGESVLVVVTSMYISACVLGHKCGTELLVVTWRLTPMAAKFVRW